MKLNAQELALGGLFGALALALPVLFHVVALAGPVFLPMVLPIAVLACLGTPRVAAMVGLMVPLLSAALTGMPPLVPPLAPLMGGELLVLGGTVGSLHHRLRVPVVPALLLGTAASRCALALELALLGPHIGFSPPLSTYVLGSLITAWPGLLLQLIVVPAVVRAAREETALP
ncbi:MAG TPA: ECF transporter S component [Armatimonadota bacterium]